MVSNALRHFIVTCCCRCDIDDGRVIALSNVLGPATLPERAPPNISCNMVLCVAFEAFAVSTTLRLP